MSGDGYQNYFACLGPARSGTSWLHNYLHTHSSAQMTTMKEMHWFDTTTQVKADKKRERMQARWTRIRAQLENPDGKLSRWQSEIRDRAQMQSDEDYHSFLTRHCQPEDVFGDITPSYGRLQQDGYARMLALFPKARLILLLRNPADNLWSRVAHARSNKQRPGTLEENFAQRLAIDSVQTRKVSIEEIHARATAFAPTAPVHCLFTEDLFSSRADQTLQELCSFLSITGAPAAQHDFTQNRGSYHPLPEDLRARAVQQFSASFAFAAKHMGRVPDSWAKDMDAYL